jgi:predicted Zn finger-like uncharacterized protein
MSMVTSCPACGTSFRVKPEQLLAHHGDVRCGKCDHVFHALDSLTRVSEDSSQSAEPKFTVLEEAGTADLFGSDNLPELAPVGTAVETPDETEHIVYPGFEQSPAAAIRQAAASVPEITPPSPAIASGPRGKSRISLWILVLLALLLASAAVAQATYFLRTQISVELPQSKSYLVKACMLLGCTVDLPRDIDQLVIYDSDMQEDADHQGVIQLSSSLINHAPYAQAYPLLELSLTDTRDKVVMRRTFTPSEYLPADRNAVSGIPPNDEIRIKLVITSGDVVAAGYRLYVTYP